MKASVFLMAAVWLDTPWLKKLYKYNCAFGKESEHRDSENVDSESSRLIYYYFLFCSEY